MRITFAFSITIKEDGSLSQQNLGYTVSATASGGFPPPEELADLMRRINARASGAAPPSQQAEFMAHSVPRVLPERPLSRPILPRDAPASFAAAERALIELGFDAEAADRACVKHGAKRVASVAEWAKMRIGQGDVKDPVKLIESCLARPPVER